MSQELEIVPLKKLKTVSPFKLFVILLCILSIIYSKVKINTFPKSDYNINQKYVTGTITKCTYNDNVKITIKGKESVLITYQNYKCKLGKKIKAIGTFSIPPENTNFNLFNYRKYLLSKNIKYIFKATNIITYNNNPSFIYIVKNKLIDYINTFKSKNHLKTFILGDNSKIESEIKESYQINGISHLLAISGMHITLLSSILLFISNKLIKNKFQSYLVVFVFLIFYLFITDFPPSILRTVFFFILLTINKQLNLKIPSIYILTLLFSLFLLINPYYLYNLGFLLSFSVTFYLIMSRKILTKAKNSFQKLFFINIIAFIGSIPILINNFHQINLITPLINLLFAPYITYIIYPLSLITLFIKPLDNILLYLINLMEKISLFITNYSFYITFCHMNTIFILLYLILITYILHKWSKNKPLYLLLIIPILFFHHYINFLNKETTITMLDVGQGDSILIRQKYNKQNILIDTGGIVSKNNDSYDITKNITIPYLKSEGIYKLNYLILTHGDFDHSGMAINLINNFKIENIILNSNDNKLEEKIINKAKEKNLKIYHVSREKIKNMYFINDMKTNDENENSLVLYMKLEEKNILMMGDASAKTENYLINTYNIPKMDILKVGHHGSKTSSNKNFINKIKPKISLISAGKNNMYGHPHKQTIENLNKSKIYVTKDDGAIKINLTKNSVSKAR